MNKTHFPLIRTIYLYIFALLGLVLIIIGGVRFLDMGLKVLIFKQADQEMSMMNKQPTMPYVLEKLETVQTSNQLTEEEKAGIKQWLVDYKQWKESNEKINYVASQRAQTASIALAMILIGLPLYIYHWSVIKKETKEREKNDE